MNNERSSVIDMNASGVEVSVAAAQRLTTCVCCGEGDLVAYLDLGTHALPNAYHLEQEPLARFPLELARCRGCSHSQLSFPVSPELRAQNDVLVCGTTAIVGRHLRALAEDVLAFTGARSVLDVGCCDGALLEEFNRLGCRVVGVDRSPSLRRITRSKGIRVLDRSWGDGATDELRATGEATFDLIVASNVLGRVGDPLASLRACMDALAPGGTIVVELPYAGAVTPRHELDLPHHDQVSYFLVRSFTALAERAGLEISHVLRTELNGGSIRFLLRVASGRPHHTPLVHALLEEERLSGLHDEDATAGVQDRVDRSGRGLARVLAEARRAGRKLVGYGATASGNVLLERFDLRLAQVVDHDPLKRGLRSPGRGVPVADPLTLIVERTAVAVVLLGWDVVEEVREELLAMRDTLKRDTLVLCAPSLREVLAADGGEVIDDEELDEAA